MSKQVGTDQRRRRWMIENCRNTKNSHIENIFGVAQSWSQVIHPCIHDHDHVSPWHHDHVLCCLIHDGNCFCVTIGDSSSFLRHWCVYSVHSPISMYNLCRFKNWRTLVLTENDVVKAVDMYRVRSCHWYLHVICVSVRVGLGPPPGSGSYIARSGEPSPWRHNPYGDQIGALSNRDINTHTQEVSPQNWDVCCQRSSLTGRNLC